MKLVFLYGPPAVGKLTVALALSTLTGYKVFHNHLTIDLVRSVFEWGTRPFWDFVNRYRLELIGAAAESNVPGLIFTFVYAHPGDDRFVRQVVQAVERHGGEVCFVQLLCSRRELFKRIKASSRTRFHKIKKPTALKALLAQSDLFSSVRYAKNLTIDNTTVSARRTAEMIKAYYRLT